MFKYNQKITELNALVDKYYTGEFDSDEMANWLAYGYINGMNDRYSDYIPVEEAEESMDSTFYGYNIGLGIQASKHPETGNIYVYAVHQDSPAEIAGIISGDEITALDEHSVSEIGYNEALNYIKGVKPGATISVTVLRNGETLVLEVELARFVSQSVFYKMVGDKGYIQITTFNEQTVDQFKTAVDDVVSQGASAIVFDLRGNGGGTLTSVHHMVDYLVPEGLVVKVDYKVDSNDETYMSDAHEIDLPMVVLTDGNTASASELFTQTLIDYGKAITVGRNTFGKGVVQRTFTLSDGSLFRFTVAKYYTASGICVDGVGIAPTIAVELEPGDAEYRFIDGIEADKDFIAACEYLDGQLS